MFRFSLVFICSRELGIFIVILVLLSATKPFRLSNVRLVVPSFIWMSPPMLSGTSKRLLSLYRRLFSTWKFGDRLVSSLKLVPLNGVVPKVSRDSFSSIFSLLLP